MARGGGRISLALLVWSFAVAAYAFTGNEHCDVSNAALKLAIRHLRNSDAAACSTPGTHCAEILSHAVELLSGKDKNKNHTFGDLTRAVDWFEDPEILTHEVAWSHADQRKRWTELPFHLLALHRNETHFQAKALEDYARFHDQAIVFARRHDPDRALYSEAVALHFLQDFFAAGHFVTPRSGFHDVVAGSLHDQYNIEGVDVGVTIPDVGPWKNLVDELEADLPFKGHDVNLVSPDIDQFRKVDGSGFLAGGDGCLKQVPAQRVLLVLASAESIVEVLTSTLRTPEYIIDVCFQPRVAEEDNHGDPVGKSGPDGGLGVSSTISGWPRLVGPCVTSEARSLAKYHLKERKIVDPVGLYFVDAVQLTALAGRGFHSNDHRRVVDVDWITGAEEPAGSLHVTKNKRETGDVFSNPLWLSYYALKFSFIKGQNFRALGLGPQYNFDVPVLRPFAFGAFVALRRYAYADNRTYRIDYGGKISVGLQFANVTVSVERGHHVDADGRFHKEIFIMPGLEIALSSSWIRHYILRQQPVCCKPKRTLPEITTTEP
jgi:hypothetical protein